MASTGVDISSPPSGDEEKATTSRLDKNRSTAKEGLEAVGVVTAVDSGDHTERRLKSRHIQLIGIGGKSKPEPRNPQNSSFASSTCQQG